MVPIEVYFFVLVVLFATADPAFLILRVPQWPKVFPLSAKFCAGRRARTWTNWLASVPVEDHPNAHGWTERSWQRGAPARLPHPRGLRLWLILQSARSAGIRAQCCVRGSAKFLLPRSIKVHRSRLLWAVGRKAAGGSKPNATGIASGLKRSPWVHSALEKSRG